MGEKQAKALRLAERLENFSGWLRFTHNVGDINAASDELRRQHARIAELEQRLAEVLAELQPASLEGLEVKDSSFGEWVESGGTPP